MANLTAASHVVVLTGAGVSAESGLRTFRDSDGLWENHRIEDVCTPEAFAANPALVHTFYNARRAQLSTAKPNPAHFALAQFAQAFGGRFTLITQNVDNLHEQAGSHVIPMHGELLKARCVQSGQVHSWQQDMQSTTPCPCCTPPSRLRPHIVWFGEMPLFMDDITAALAECDLFVAIGTSGHVYPAAGFVQQARASGAHTVELNLEPSLVRTQFAEAHYGPASAIVPEFFDRIARPV